MPELPAVIPFSFDLPSLVRRSVVSLYSPHLVTRPTGRALRLAIESQIDELGSRCLSVLDFTQVVVLDYSCADEVVAKLVQRFQAADRPADAYFVARGLGEQHREPIDEVLKRHDLTLVTEIGAAFVLLGHVHPIEDRAWHILHRAVAADAGEIARHMDVSPRTAAEALDGLVRRRVVIRAHQDRYSALPTLLR